MSDLLPTHMSQVLAEARREREVAERWKQRAERAEAELAKIKEFVRRVAGGPIRDMPYRAVDAKQMVAEWDKSCTPAVRYGCHCDIEHGYEPDDCVIDKGRIEDCSYAKTGMKKEECEYWKAVRGE